MKDTPQTAWERRHNTDARTELVDDLLAVLQDRHDDLRKERGALGWLLPSDAPDHVKTQAAYLDAQLEELGQTLITVRGTRRNRLEYYDFDTTNRKRPVEQVHRDHAAHVDVCAICRQEQANEWQALRAEDRLARIRGLLARGGHLLEEAEGATPKAAAKLLKQIRGHIDRELDNPEPAHSTLF